MNYLLRLKHWQLFLLIIGLPAIIEITLRITMIRSEGSLSGFANKNFLSFIVRIISMAVSIGWLYAIGTNFHKKLPDSVKMNLVRFKVIVFILAVYAQFFCIFLAFMINEEILGLSLYKVINTVHTIIMFCLLYCLHFNARVIKAVELQRPVTFGDFSEDFLLLLIYPIGIWIIQPRINNLFENKNALPV